MEAVVDIASWLCLLGGSAFCVIGGIGMLRMPDFYTRSHAASLTDTLGAALILLGLGLQSGFNLVSAKLVLVLIFLYLTSPTATHALVKAAYSRGLLAPDVEDERGSTSGAGGGAA
jgi:multicomponent Na+:H+ antiporter subunit G